MEGSFKGSALEKLLQEAEAFQPNFWCKGKQIDSDVVVMVAPARIGKLLALRSFKYAPSKKAGGQKRSKADAATLSLIDNIVAHELRSVTAALERADELVLRNNGNIVRIKHGGELAARQLVTATV